MESEGKVLCQLCGEPMPKGEEMFNYHGHSCDCPKKIKPPSTTDQDRDDILRIANQIVEPHGLKAEMLDIQSVGVGGDSRLYAPVIVLVGAFPGWEVIAEVSTEISNKTGGCKVTIEIAKR